MIALTGVAGKSLALPGTKQARNHVSDARDFNNIETRAVINFFFFLQNKAPKEIRAILTEILACFLPGRAKDLSAPLYLFIHLILVYLRSLSLSQTVQHRRIIKGRTNLGGQVARTTEFCTTDSNICDPH